MKLNEILTCDLVAPHVDDFFVEQSEAGYSNHTLRAKQIAMRTFLRWRHDSERSSLDFDEQEIERFVNRSLNQDKARRSMEYATLKALLNYLRRTGVISSTSDRLND